MSSTPYDRQTSFALFSAENPGEPHSGATLDAEFNAVKVGLDDTQQNLALIQDDDGALKRGSVGKEQFDASVTIGFGAPSAWASGQIYTAEVDTVFYQSKFYIAAVTHTSGVSFVPANWTEIADFTLAAVIADGTITSAKLAAGAVTADKIADGSISNSKMATGAISTPKIADQAVTIAKIDAGIGPELAKLVIPAGLGPLPWSGLTAPTGWVFAGATYLRATYPALWAFAAVEIAAGNLFYGVGDGLTNFTIASMAGRVPAGREASASRLTATYFGGDSTKVGATGGLESNNVILTHNHGITDPGHDHAEQGSPAGGASTSLYKPNNGTSGVDSASTSRTQSNTTGITVTNAGSASAHNIVQPTITFNYIVKAH